jgi:hypothetical protein
MKTAFVLLILSGLLVTGYSLNLLSGRQPAHSSHAAQADSMNEAAMRHKLCQPKHWRSMFLQTH